MSWFELAAELQPLVLRGDTPAAIERVVAEIRKLPTGPFHAFNRQPFTNDPASVAEHFDALAGLSEAGALYTETNGFDINPSRWYFDVFTYPAHGGHDKRDWLSKRRLCHPTSVTLTGLERLQKVYASPAFEDEALRSAAELCSLLVVCKFQDLIQKAVPLMKRVRVPVLASGHDYDSTLIAEFQPSHSAETTRR